jgi:uncharacterized membrane protein
VSGDQVLAGKLLSGLLIITILAVVASIIVLAVLPHKGEGFTEFYLLGLNGKADNHPTSAKVGERVAVTVGIVNKENKSTTYHISVKTNDFSLNEIEPITLGDAQKWEKPVSFVVKDSGANQRIDFVLYKDGQSEPYITLNLLINVK